MNHFKDPPKLFLALTAAYFLTSLGHFTHNAEFICEYPNLPAWLTRAKVYAAWAAITSVGVVGLHTLASNVTILSEVAAAALLLPVTLYLLARHWVRGGRRVAG